MYEQKEQNKTKHVIITYFKKTWEITGWKYKEMYLF